MAAQAELTTQTQDLLIITYLTFSTDHYFQNNWRNELPVIILLTAIAHCNINDVAIFTLLAHMT